jgi:hypothetical protein
MRTAADGWGSPARGANQGGDRQVGTRRFSRDRDSGGILTAVEQRPVRRHGVERRRRMGIFRGQAIVHGDDPHMGLAGEVGGEAHGGRGRSDGEGATMEVQDDSFDGEPGDLKADHRDAP